MAYYANKGYTPDVLSNLSNLELMFLNAAREEHYKEEAELIGEIFDKYFNTLYTMLGGEGN